MLYYRGDLCWTTVSPNLGEKGGFTFEFSSRCKDHHPRDPHVHAWKDGIRITIPLRRPVKARKALRMADHEIAAAERIVDDNFDEMLEGWYDHFQR